MNYLQHYSGLEKFAEVSPMIPSICALKMGVILVGSVKGLLASQGECFALIMAPWS